MSFHIPKADLLEYAPITKKHVAEGGMPLDALCAAAIELSDNTAGNLLLQTIGGPEGFTRYARSLGDEKTRLDRIEPDLNSALPGDERDTTTPASDGGQPALAAASVTRCRKLPANSSKSWLVANTTGGEMIRAGRA